MKIIIQRVKKSSVHVDNQLIAEINQGMTLLVCIEKNDQLPQIENAAKKIEQLRIFTDPETGKMNKSLEEVGGEILAVSQFTLSWNGKKGNRPSFDQSKDPEEALTMFNHFCNLLSQKNQVKKGPFREHMVVSIVNDGPVTFSLDF